MTDTLVIQRPSSAPAHVRGAVIVVVYGRGDDLPGCLHSLRAHLPPDVAVIVVDNASEPPLAAAVAPAFPEVHFLRTSANHGYAGGNNAGAAYAFTLGAPLLYFLNDDTEVNPRFWQTCEDAVRDRGASIVGSVLVRHQRPDEIELAGWHLDLRTLEETFRGTNAKYGPDFAGYHACDAAFGAGFMVRSDLFHAKGGFDESFFHLSEEIDFCLRARCKGAIVAYAGQSVVRHKGGASLSHQTPRYTFYFFRNRLWLWRRHTNLGVFLLYAPRRVARLWFNQLTGASWLRRSVPNLFAAFGGALAGFCWWRAPRTMQFRTPAPAFPTVPAQEPVVAR